VVTGFHRPNLSFEVRATSSRASKITHLVPLIRDALNLDGVAVVYAATRKNVEWLAETLRARGLAAGYYHAGLSEGDRTAVQEAFQDGTLRILVATNAFGMGIDKPNVRMVAHFDIPSSVEAYYQEAGRAGRDGQSAQCVLLFSHADVSTQEYLLERRNDAEAARDLLKQMVRYAYAKTCRQHLILEYFGDEERDKIQLCGHCDHCKRSETDSDLTRGSVDERTQIAGKAALTTVVKLGSRFGKTRVAEVLKGSNSASVREMGLQTVPTYGTLRSWKIAELRELLEKLIDAGYLHINGMEYPVLGITEQGRNVLKGQSEVRL